MPKVSRPKSIYIGIDPGASGGLVALGYDGSSRITSMPESEADVWLWLSAFGPPRIAQVFAVIEQVGGHVGGAGQPGSAMFKFGMSYGGLRMALTTASIPFEAVTPQRWQRAMGVTPRDGNGGETKTQFKNRLKARAQQLFPREKVTLATADALLIAEYCRRFREGTLR